MVTPQDIVWPRNNWGTAGRNGATRKREERHKGLDGVARNFAMTVQGGRNPVGEERASAKNEGHQ